MSVEKEDWGRFRPDADRVAKASSLVRLNNVEDRSYFVGLLNSSGVADERITFSWHSSFAALTVQQLNESEFWQLMQVFWKEMQIQDGKYRERDLSFDDRLQYWTGLLLDLKAYNFRCGWILEGTMPAAEIRRRFNEQCGDVNPPTT